MAKQPKTAELQQQITDLTADLQRTRADFENYRKRVESEKQTALTTGEMRAILKLLPIIDTIERAVAHTPKELADNSWVKGVMSLTKTLEKALHAMGITRIAATPGVHFDPEYHEAVQMDEDATGDIEVIAEELQAGYMLNDIPLRHAMVKVTRK
ncbi:nucleotide exchange factor GrpE [Candidatus Saccharibacteria bacterium]|nr:nucleotide exchange factor GrpE [Candidatus Saccharibacteria bacterium]